MTTSNTLAYRLKISRQNKGLSQSELAKAARISQSAVAAIETGRNKSSTHIAKFAAILGINPIWLETGKNKDDMKKLPDVMFFSIITDNSMSPVLPIGTEVKLKTEQEIQNQKIYCIEYGGEKMYRLLFRLPKNQVKIKAYNDDFDDFIVNNDQIQVIGRIIEWYVKNQ